MAARRVHTAFVQRALPWALPVLILLTWELASVSGWLSTRVLPEPLAVATAFWNLCAPASCGSTCW